MGKFFLALTAVAFAVLVAVLVFAAFHRGGVIV
jgi:hypothetical protein